MVVCRACKSTDLQKVLSLGESPLANNFLTKEELNQREKFYPLDLFFCNKCSLVQLGYIVPAEEMYSNYLYVPSSSQTFVKHFEEMATEIRDRFDLSSTDMVVDIGGNDGTLLKNFEKMGVKVLNVEPAANIAKLAEESGVETINDYFTKETAEKIVNTRGKAKVTIATNVFTHVDDIGGLIEGVKSLLTKDGVFIIEVYYLGGIIKNTSFDIIYHEHLSYFTLYSLINLFKRFGLDVFDVEKVSSHGGSLRLFVCMDSFYQKSYSVDKIISEEMNEGLNSPSTYINFAKRLDEIKNSLVQMINRIKTGGGNIVGYGAPAKSTTLLNYFGIRKESIDYIVDKNPMKQNRYTPGTHIPIFSPSKIIEDKPDYVLILAWNVADEIMKQENEYKISGGKFIIPIPEPKIVE